jgi:hypothetical protein
LEINLLSEELLQHFKDDWKGVKSGTKAVEVSRVKTLVRQTLKDLALVAEKLPEKHLAGVFTVETLMPFIKALVYVNPKEKHLSADENRRVERLSRICREILHELSAKSHIIAPESTRVLVSDAPRRDMSMRLTALLIGY